MIFCSGSSNCLFVHFVHTAGRTCIKPTADFEETADGLPEDSTCIIEATKFGDMPCLFDTALTNCDKVFGLWVMLAVGSVKGTNVSIIVMISKAVSGPRWLLL